MSKSREWRDKRDMKHHDSIQRIVSDTARPLLERVCVHELAEDERTKPRNLYLPGWLSKENEGN